MSYEIVRITDRPELLETARPVVFRKVGDPAGGIHVQHGRSTRRKGPRPPSGTLALEGERIAGGMGVIENDFHNRKTSPPNVCAVYTEPDRRGKGIAGALLRFVCADMAGQGIRTLYLLTDHTGFYERYGWEFYCMVQGDGEEALPGCTGTGRNNGGCLESLCPCRMLPALFHRRAVIGKRRIWMIFYFSATGNSRWAGPQAGRTDRGPGGGYGETQPSSYDLTGQTVGLVSRSMPGGCRSRWICLSGSSGGSRRSRSLPPPAGRRRGKALDKLNRYFPLDSRYTLIMPDNYVFWLEPETGEAGKEKVRAAAEKLPRIAAEISARKPVTDVRVGLLAGLKSGPVNKGFNRFARSTRPFYGRHPLQRLRALRQRLPGPHHPVTGREAPVGGKMLPVHRLHQPLPHRGDPVRERTRKAGGGTGLPSRNEATNQGNCFLGNKNPRRKLLRGFSVILLLPTGSRRILRPEVPGRPGVGRY